MMNPKVSILIPVYNVSKFIEKCAISVFEQTFDNLEFVFVNDCTLDDSIEKLHKVIEQYPKKKEQIKIITHHENKGLSSTRNTLIANATGEYVFFVDSDDYIEKNTIELLVNQAIVENSDIVLCNIFREWKRGKTINNITYNPNPKEYLKMLLAGNSPAYTCAKLMRRSLFNDIHFPDNLRFLEDFCTITRVVYAAKKITKVEETFYHYIQYNTSALSKKWDEEKWNEIVRAFDTILLFLKSKDDSALFLNSMEILKLRIRITYPSHFSKKMYETIADYLKTERNDLLKMSINEKNLLYLFDNKYYTLFTLYSSCFDFLHNTKKKIMG